MQRNLKDATEEQIAYAKILDISAAAAFVLLVVLFVIYLTGLLEAHIPLTDLPKYWGLPLHDYLEKTNYTAGWSWLNMIGRGDFLNFVAISFLCVITIFCYIRIIPILVRKRDIAYVVIAAIEVVILVLAASGRLTIGR